MTSGAPGADTRRSPAPQRFLATAALGLNAALAVSAAPAAPVAAPAARIEAQYDAGAFALGEAGVRTWIERSARIVAGYYGRFPVPVLRLRIEAIDGRGVHGGTAYPGEGPNIRVRLGRDTGAAALESDWVLVHEMVHLALPEVADEHHWLSEGLATYVEGMARVMAGNMSAQELWQEYAEQMPKGEPAPGDAGLDRTHSWASTYWGGALFCLDADVAIREATRNRQGLREALRGILLASGGMRAEWPIERVLAAGDAATGTDVLTRLYAERRARPVATDLAALWARLGVAVDGGRVVLKDDAPLAGVRRALTAADRSAPPAVIELAHLAR